MNFFRLMIMKIIIRKIHFSIEISIYARPAFESKTIGTKVRKPGTTWLYSLYREIFLNDILNSQNSWQAVAITQYSNNAPVSHHWHRNLQCTEGGLRRKQHGVLCSDSELHLSKLEFSPILSLQFL